MAGSAPTLCTTPQGRRALIYLVSPRTRRHFTPAQISQLAEADAARSRTSKKDNQIRTEEIRKAASEPLLAWVAAKGEEVVRDPGGSLVVGEIMLNADGDKSAASQTILKCLATPYPSVDPSSPHPISLPHASRLYKLLLQGGHYSQSTSSVENSPNFSSLDFASKFIEVVGEEAVVAMARDDGAFVVAALCATVAAAGDEADLLKATMREWFSKGVIEELESDKDRRGRGVLLAQLRALF